MKNTFTPLAGKADEDTRASTALLLGLAQFLVTHGLGLDRLEIETTPAGSRSCTVTVTSWGQFAGWSQAFDHADPSRGSTVAGPTHTVFVGEIAGVPVLVTLQRP
jgi:hypothetical protein